jgi:hypothetical protein
MARAQGQSCEQQKAKTPERQLQLCIAGAETERSREEKRGQQDKPQKGL